MIMMMIMIMIMIMIIIIMMIHGVVDNSKRHAVQSLLLSQYKPLSTERWMKVDQEGCILERDTKNTFCFALVQSIAFHIVKCSKVHLYDHSSTSWWRYHANGRLIGPPVILLTHTGHAYEAKHRFLAWIRGSKSKTWASSVGTYLNWKVVCATICCQTYERPAVASVCFQKAEHERFFLLRSYRLLATWQVRIVCYVWPVLIKNSQVPMREGSLLNC